MVHGNKPPSSGTLSIRMRSYLSPTHLEAAVLTARSAEKLELARDLQALRAIPAYACASITSAVSFVEATVNELAADIAEDNKNAAHVGSEHKQAVSESWGGSTDRRKSVSERANALLARLGKEAIPKGAAPG